MEIWINIVGQEKEAINLLDKYEFSFLDYADGKNTLFKIINEEKWELLKVDTIYKDISYHGKGSNRFFCCCFQHIHKNVSDFNKDLKLLEKQLKECSKLGI
jgi:hypothetical protein